MNEAGRGGIMKQEITWHLGATVSSSALLKVSENVARDSFGPWDSWIDLRESRNPLDITTKCELTCLGECAIF